MTVALPNPYSPYADADPLYRHLLPTLLPSMFGEPAPGALVVAGCDRMVVVPDEPLRAADEPDAELPAGVCPACIAALRGDRPAPATAVECQRCESTTRHTGLCALCRQEKHADWWQASNTYARPFRLTLPGKRTLDGAVFPGGQAVVIDDPEDALASAAPSLEQLLTGYHRAEVMFAEEMVPVALARAQHAVQLYAETAIERDDARRELGQREAAVARAKKLATQWAVLRAYGGATTELRAVLEGQEPNALPAGFTASTCLTVKCAVCEYEFDEDEDHTIHFVSVEQAHQVLRDHGWTVLDDGRAVCDHDDEQHVALLPPAADAPSQPVMTGQHHFGRAWTGHDIEDNCPCTKAPCGLVAEPSAECTEHTGTKSTRQSHPADACPGPDAPDA
ncbi:hypothetical protein [Streptomyces fagopyri]